MRETNSCLKVAITQRVDFVKTYKEVRDAVDQELVKWIIQAGFLPFPVPNTLLIANSRSTDLKFRSPLLLQWLQKIQPNALLLSGGNDIGEQPERDATEQFLLSWAKSRYLPVLGICRGMQMLAVWSGTKLLKIENHVKVRHSLIVENQDENWPTEVNSFHQWSLTGCPPGFETKAHTDDGLIEAIAHKELPWEGWMWHPERESTFNDCDTNRLISLFCRQHD